MVVAMTNRIPHAQHLLLTCVEQTNRVEATIPCIDVIKYPVNSTPYLVWRPSTILHDHWSAITAKLCVHNKGSILKFGSTLPAHMIATAAENKNVQTRPNLQMNLVESTKCKQTLDKYLCNITVTIYCTFRHLEQHEY